MNRRCSRIIRITCICTLKSSYAVVGFGVHLLHVYGKINNVRVQVMSTSNFCRLFGFCNSKDKFENNADDVSVSI